MKQALRLACLSLLLAGCLPTGPDSSGREQLRRNRERWEALQPTTYEFVLQRICECGPPWSTPLRITVAERQVASVVNDQTGESVPADSDQVKSIENLFALIEEALEQGASRVTAEYDPDFGHPTWVYIDPDEQMVDEETGYSVLELRAVP